MVFDIFHAGKHELFRLRCSLKNPTREESFEQQLLENIALQIAKVRLRNAVKS